MDPTLIFDEQEPPTLRTSRAPGPRDWETSVAHAASSDGPVEPDADTVSAWNTFLNVASAARRADTYTSLSNSGSLALQDAADSRIGLIKNLTGQSVQNPFNASPFTGSELEDPFADPQDKAALQAYADDTGYRPGTIPDWRQQEELRKYRTQAFYNQLSDLAQKYPDNAAVIGADRPVDIDAAAVARATDFIHSYVSKDSGVAGFLGDLAGGVAASVRDPLQVGSLAFGGGEIKAVSTFGKIVEGGIRQALVNAGVQAMSEPSVQAWRAKIGMDSGVMPALTDVGMAALFGFIPGAALGPLHGRGKLDPQTAATLSRKAIGGDLEAAGELADAMPKEIAPELHAAIDAERADRAAVADRPEGMEPADSAQLAREAIRHAEDPENEPLAGLNAAPVSERQKMQITEDAENNALPEQQAAILNTAPNDRLPDFAPETPEKQTETLKEELSARFATQPDMADLGKPPETLLAFLKRMGGIKDEGGELSNRGLIRQYPGLVNNRAGLSLDAAREAAAEAGYLGGDTNRVTSETMVNDLLDAIDRHPVYSVHDERAVAERAQAQTVKDYNVRLQDSINGIQAHLAEHGIAPIDDLELLHEAGDLWMRGHTQDPADALERAAIMLYNRDVEQVLSRHGSEAPRIVENALTDNEREFLKSEFSRGFDEGDQAGARLGNEGGSGAAPEAVRATGETPLRAEAGGGEPSPAVRDRQVPEVEPGAEGKPQTVLPGAERASDAIMAQRGADAPLQARAPQNLDTSGLALFGDSHKQTDLFDQVPVSDKADASDMRLLSKDQILDERPREELLAHFIDDCSM